IPAIMRSAMNVGLLFCLLVFSVAGSAQASRRCLGSCEGENDNRGPIQIEDVILENAKSLPAERETQLKESLKGQVFGKLGEVRERIRDAYGEAGFFKVELGALKVRELGGELVPRVEITVPILSEGA